MRLRDHLSLFFLLLNAPTPSTCKLARRSARPHPISISPSQNWDGNDGPWSSFTIQLGTSIQNVRVLVSTALSDTWVINDDGCVKSQASCNEDRGRTFAPSSSKTWKQMGNTAFNFNEEIGAQVNGTLGYDNYTLGLQGSGGPTLVNQPVVAYTSQDLNQGMFGANALAITGSNKLPGFITSLKNQSRIPSASFGYTAGNQYRLKKVYGSLTLGGYDSSLITPNPLTISFTGSDPLKYLQIAIQSITSKDQSGKTAALLPTPITAHIDSTTSMLWLPKEACKAFEDTFSLKLDQKSDLYLVGEDLHSQLMEQNASVTFQFSNQTNGGISANITLPYASFDLFVKPPFSGIASNQRYFPLRRAANDSEFVLGRTLLQEAYLTVDWDRRNFSLQQCNYTADIPEHKFVSIYTPGEEPAPSMSTGTKVGIAVGLAVGLILVISLTSWLLWRRKRAKRRLAEELAKSGINPKEGMIRQGLAKGEMGAGIDNALYEMEGSDGNALKPYGGQTPPWVDEKARYPGLGFSPDSVAEIDGVSHRAELGGAIGFFGGRGVHEMYDPSSVPPIELPTSSSEAPSPSLSGMRSTGESSRTLLSRPSSSSKPSPLRSSLFGVFHRRSRDASTTARGSSPGISGPSNQPSPKHAEQVVGIRGQPNLITTQQPLQRSAAPQPTVVEEEPPPVPPRDYEAIPRSEPRSAARSATSISSISTKYQQSDINSIHEGPGVLRNVQSQGRDERRLDRIQTAQRPNRSGQSRPSVPSTPVSPHTVGQRRIRVQSHASTNSGRTARSNEILSPLSRQGTANIFSPVSPDNENGSSHQKGYFGGFRGFTR